MSEVIAMRNKFKINCGTQKQDLSKLSEGWRDSDTEINQHFGFVLIFPAFHLDLN